MPEFGFETPGLTPEEALAFWKDRVPLTESEIRKLSEGARSRAFTAAGLARQEQVALVHQALQEAMENGTGLKEFKERIAPLLAEKGWQGHRIANILRTNMQTAYSAGRWAQMQSTKKYFPYLEYYTVGDSRVRPSHAVLGGMVFPIDHPFWDANYPPNGFSCRCGARAVSGREVERRGLEVQKEIPRDLLYKDPKTGMEYRVARPGADDGFRNNPGKDWLAGLSAREAESGKVKERAKRATCFLPGNFADSEIRRLGFGADCLPPLSEMDKKYIMPVKASDILPKGLKDEEYALAFLKEFGLKSLDASTLFRLPFLRTPLLIDKNLFLDKDSGKFKSNKRGRGPYLPLLAQCIKNPYELWQVPVSLSGRPYLCLRFIRLFRLEESSFSGYAAFNWIGGGRYWTGATVFRHEIKTAISFDYLEAQRNGVLLFREDGGGVLQK